MEGDFFSRTNLCSSFSENRYLRCKVVWLFLVLLWKQHFLTESTFFFCGQLLNLYVTNLRKHRIFLKARIFFQSSYVTDEGKGWERAKWVHKCGLSVRKFECGQNPSLFWEHDSLIVVPRRCILKRKYFYQVRFARYNLDRIKKKKVGNTWESLF